MLSKNSSQAVSMLSEGTPYKIQSSKLPLLFKAKKISPPTNKMDGNRNHMYKNMNYHYIVLAKTILIYPSGKSVLVTSLSQSLGL